MLWFKLCVFLVLFSDTVFGFWGDPFKNFPRIPLLLRNRSFKGKRSSTTASAVDMETEQSILTETQVSEISEIITENTNPEANLPPFTESPALCSTSLHNKEDLLIIFNYFQNNQHVYDNIMNSFQSDALSVRDKHLANIAAFQKLFQGKPEHLKHILKDVEKSRYGLLPYVENISKSKKQYSDLYDQFQEKKEQLLKLFNDFERQKKICELMCTNDVFLGRQMVQKDEMAYDENEFYCASIAEVQNEMQTALSNFSHHYQEILQKRLNDDDIKYAIEIEQLKLKLKNLALKEFGHTMYDIFDLIDSYHHFSEEVKKGESKAILAAIKQNIAQINPKMLTLEVAVQKLTKYHQTCSNNFVNRQLIRKEQDEDSTSNYSENLLNNVVATELRRLQNVIEGNYKSIFVELVNAIDKANSTNSYLDDMKEIQKEIAAATKAEYDEITQLRLMIATPARINLLELQEESNNLLIRIDEKIRFVDDFVR